MDRKRRCYFVAMCGNVRNERTRRITSETNKRDRNETKPQERDARMNISAFKIPEASLTRSVSYRAPRPPLRPAFDANEKRDTPPDANAFVWAVMGPRSVISEISLKLEQQLPC